MRQIVETCKKNDTKQLNHDVVLKTLLALLESLETMSEGLGVSFKGCSNKGFALVSPLQTLQQTT